MNRFYRALYSKIYDLSRHTSKPSKLYFHVLFKAMKYDINNRNRFIAFIKRIYSMACIDTINPSISCAMSFLVNQLCSVSTIHKSIFQSRLIKQPRSTKNNPSSSWTSLDDILIPKRDPDSKDYLWEVTLLQYHYHPSCSKFVNNTMDTTNTTYQGNPLVDFSLMHFLDKFAYKQPKKQKKSSNKNTNNTTFSFQSKERAYSILANDDTFTLQPEHTVQEQDLFFYKYFNDKKGNNTNKQQNTITKSDKQQQLYQYDSDDDDDIIDNLNIQNDDDVEDDHDYDDNSEDPEEEAFATKLAEQLMQNQTKGKKTVQDLDDEDPNDLDDWSYDTDDDNDDVDIDDDGSFPTFSDEDDDDDDDNVKISSGSKSSGKKNKHEVAYADAD